MAENLRRLGRDHLDLVNLRIVKRPGRDSIAERFGYLADLRDKGLIRHLGLSNVRPDHLAEAQVIAPVARGGTCWPLRAPATRNTWNRTSPPARCA